MLGKELNNRHHDRIEVTGTEWDKNPTSEREVNQALHMQVGNQSSIMIKVDY